MILHVLCNKVWPKLGDTARATLTHVTPPLTPSSEVVGLRRCRRLTPRPTKKATGRSCCVARPYGLTFGTTRRRHPPVSRATTQALGPTCSPYGVLAPGSEAVVHRDLIETVVPVPATVVREVDPTCGVAVDDRTSPVPVVPGAAVEAQPALRTASSGPCLRLAIRARAPDALVCLAPLRPSRGWLSSRRTVNEISADPRDRPDALTLPRGPRRASVGTALGPLTPVRVS